MAEESTFGERKEAADELYGLLSRFSGIDDEQQTEASTEASDLSTGIAISPLDAARCVKDFARTSAFLRGVSDAIDTARRLFPERPLNVIYAGCGPFAPLVLPVAHRWPKSDVRFTLIDYHASSLESARHLARELDVADRIETFVQADAAEFEWSAQRPAHVLIVETMQRALEKEPQVAITRNLGRQLVEGGLVVPERIELHLALIDAAREMKFDGDAHRRRRLELGPVLTLSRDGGSCHDAVWPNAVPVDMDPCILTRIQVFGEHRLGDYDSGITMPAIIRDWINPEPGGTVRFRYSYTPWPRLVHERP